MNDRDLASQLLPLLRQMVAVCELHVATGKYAVPEPERMPWYKEVGFQPSGSLRKDILNLLLLRPGLRTTEVAEALYDASGPVDFGTHKRRVTVAISDMHKDRGQVKGERDGKEMLWSVADHMLVVLMDGSKVFGTSELDTLENQKKYTPHLRTNEFVSMASCGSYSHKTQIRQYVCAKPLSHIEYSEERDAEDVL